MPANPPVICVEKPAGFVGTRLVAALGARGMRCISIEERERNADGPCILLLNRWGSVPSSTADSTRAEVVKSLLPLLDFVDAANWRNFDHVVFLSSAGAIYAPTRALADERTVPVPSNNYAAGKLAAEAFLTTAAMRHGFPLTILRPSNLYGPGQSCRPGFGIVPAVYMSLSGGPPVQRWPGSEVRKDYLFIDDFIEALIAALLGSAPQRGNVRVFNVASGHCANVPELIALCTEIRMNDPRAVDSPGTRVLDAGTVAPDARRFRDHYGWTPRHDLRMGLRTTFDWLDRLKA